MRNTYKYYGEKMRKYLKFALVSCMLLSSIIINAKTLSATEQTDNSNSLSLELTTELSTLARNATQEFTETYVWDVSDISIDKITPLYDSEQKIANYCIDMTYCNDDEKHAYVILSNDSNCYPIVQFAPDARSQYYDIADTLDAYFILPGDYFILSPDEDDTLTSLISGMDTDLSDFDGLDDWYEHYNAHNHAIRKQLLTEDASVKVTSLSKSSSSSYNTFATYKSYINNSNPVCVGVSGGTANSPAYSDGFGDHWMTGVGYSVTAGTNYLIVHTTAQSDGNIYVLYSSFSLGDFEWCLFKK